MHGGGGYKGGRAEEEWACSLCTKSMQGMAG